MSGSSDLELVFRMACVYSAYCAEYSGTHGSPCELGIFVDDDPELPPCCKRALKATG